MNWIALIIRIPDDNVVKKVLQFKVTWIGKCGRPRLKWQESSKEVPDTRGADNEPLKTDSPPNEF
ncbi:UNVERIFIED_CONTAM: hypothetical protein NCL1_14322 [Trichonephila clavipes]